jgi:hypothetical protein
MKLQNQYWTNRNLIVYELRLRLGASSSPGPRSTLSESNERGSGDEDGLGFGVTDRSAINPSHNRD